MIALLVALAKEERLLIVFCLYVGIVIPKVLCLVPLESLVDL